MELPFQKCEHSVLSLKVKMVKLKEKAQTELLFPPHFSYLMLMTKHSVSKLMQGTHCNLITLVQNNGIISVAQIPLYLYLQHFTLLHPSAAFILIL